MSPWGVLWSCWDYLGSFFKIYKKLKWAGIKIGGVRKMNHVCPHTANLVECVSKEL